MRRAAMLMGFVWVLGLGPVAGADPAGIAGSWVFEANGASVTLVLGGDGTGTFNELQFTWTYAGTALTLTSGGQSLTYGAVRHGDALELSGGDLPGPATFRRASAPSGPIVGTWAYTAGNTTVLLALAADGSGTFNGVGLRWQYAGTTLTVTAPAGQVVAYQAVVHGDRLDVSGGDLPAPVAMQRQGAVRPAAPATLVGTWLYASGDVRYTLELAGDGSGKFNGAPFKWKHAGTTLTVTGPNGNNMAYQAALHGDSLDVSGGDLPGPVTLQRQGSGAAAAPASGLAGVYSCTESSMDPSIVLIYTQYVTLFPDGTVGYQKSEGGASRSQVTQNLERFRSWHQGGPASGNAGRWESDGATIVVRWRLWNNLVSRGRVDAASGRFQLSGMGVLAEGATLTFKHE